MNFSIHIDDHAARELKRLARLSRKTRNALINEAVRAYLRQRQRQKWPEAVRSLAGAGKGLPPFESHRRELKAPGEDPLS